jgi:hypothetical protein
VCECGAKNRACSLQMRRQRAGPTSERPAHTAPNYGRIRCLEVFSPLTGALCSQLHGGSEAVLQDFYRGGISSSGKIGTARPVGSRCGRIGYDRRRFEKSRGGAETLRTKR